jgi:DNA-binding MarR family transcriptional regulator
MGHASLVTLTEILEHNFSQTDSVSEAVCKLLLIVLWKHQNKPIPVTELARVCGAGERTTYRALRALEDRNYVGCGRSPDDNKTKFYYLTWSNP